MRKIALSVALCLPLAPLQAQETPEIEVIHWLTAGAEAASLQVLSEAFSARGGNWVDTPAPGGGGDANAMLMSRFAGGNPPGASFAGIGPGTRELGAEGVLRDLRDTKGIDTLAQIMVSLATGVDGALYALPIALETQNYMWVSPKAFEIANVALPETWEDFIASAPAFEKQGIIPIAVGAQGWQLAILFSSIILDAGGAELYRNVVMEHNVDAASSEAMVGAFATYKALAHISDQGAANRAWNETLNLVAEGKAALQVMGSWAGAELNAMQLSYGTDWSCALTPGSNAVIVEGAGFQFPLQKDPNLIEGQNIFASVLLDPEVQIAYSSIKGSMPALLGADASTLGPCTQIASKVLSTPDQGGLATMGASFSTQGWGEVQDLLAQVWSDPSFSPQDAVHTFAALVAAE